MATLERIRSKAAFLLIVIGFALLAFIIGDFLQSSSSFFQRNQEKILTVNGETVNYPEFIARVEERTEQLKQNGQSFNEDEQNQIRQMVLNAYIDELLFAEETEKLGLTVSKEEFQDLILGRNISPVLLQIPDFRDQQTGGFNHQALMQFLQFIESDGSEYPEEYQAQLEQMKKSWQMLSKQIKEERLSRKFASLLTSAILVNDLEARAAFNNTRVSVDFDYVAQSVSVIPDDAVSVSEAEIQRRYNERKEQFKQTEAQVIDYIAVNILPSQQDFQTVETKLLNVKDQLTTTESVAELVQNNSDRSYVDAYAAYASFDESAQQFLTANSIGAIEGPVLVDGVYHLYKYESEKTAPDSVNLNILALPVAYDEAQFTHLTDSLINVVKTGTAFADMAKSATNGQTDGKMGWVTETQLSSQVDAKFKDAVFSAPLNQIFLAKSNTGSFLVEVTEKTAPVKKYKLADIQVRVMPGQDTKTELYNKLSQFISANHSLDALKDNAAEAGYNIQTNVEVAKDQISLGNVQGSRQVIQWAFNNKKGSISDIYECQNSEYFVVAAVEDHLKEGYRSLASVSDMLKYELLNEKKGAKLVEDLKAKNFTTLDEYAQAMNATPQSVKFMNFATNSISGIGMEPILNAELPNETTKPNQIAGPYAGKNRVYVAYVTLLNINESQYNAQTQKEQLQTQNMYRNYQLTQNSELLRENAKITNNFLRFF
ncbi:MAG: SurA N-terminal domain-containing protein [Candidatus Symbiothrix sp.]|jgi:peptidyl-prolyl cis-trans isomerase D|nr:SurA N-terminal domain-containing protein [Candidatus Symbiothrix sp.]